MYICANISSSLSVDKSVELHLVLKTFVVSSFWSSKLKSAHVGAFVVLGNQLKSSFFVDSAASDSIHSGQILFF